MEERRQAERTPHLQTISYSVAVLDFKSLKKLNLGGGIFDISERGMGFKTNYPLEPGHVLTFDGIEHKTGIVKWSKALDADEYRVGIQLV